MFTLLGGKPESKSREGILDPGVIAAKASTEVAANKAPAKKERSFMVLQVSQNYEMMGEIG